MLSYLLFLYFWKTYSQALCCIIWSTEACLGCCCSIEAYNRPWIACRWTWKTRNRLCVPTCHAALFFVGSLLALGPDVPCCVEDSSWALRPDEICCVKVSSWALRPNETCCCCRLRGLNCRVKEALYSWYFYFFFLFSFFFFFLLLSLDGTWLDWASPSKNCPWNLAIYIWVLSSGEKISKQCSIRAKSKDRREIITSLFAVHKYPWIALFVNSCCAIRTRHTFNSMSYEEPYY